MRAQDSSARARQIPAPVGGIPTDFDLGTGIEELSHEFTLPSRLVESAIAASVVLAALNNVWPVVRHRLWLLAFGFGLVHGLGFASALLDLGLPTHALAVPLLAFNLGVEFGQLALVALILPIAFLLRETALYPRLMLRVCSSAIAGVGGIWLLERLFDLRLI